MKTWAVIGSTATLTNVMPIANIAHGGGALMGILTGFAIARPDRRFPIVAGIVALVLLSLCAATIWRPAVNLSGRQGYEEGRWGYDALMANSNQEAVRWLCDAVQYQPRKSAYWLDLGIAYERLNDKPAAINAYRKAADLGNAAAKSHLSELYTIGSPK